LPGLRLFPLLLDGGADAVEQIDHTEVRVTNGEWLQSVFTKMTQPGEVEPDTKTLLVVPASLLENWQREAAKFAPKMRVFVVHGGNIDFSPEDADFFITTYGMAARLEKLTAVAWNLLILDEAQAIKNPGINQSKAVKKLDSNMRASR
jgi:SNF2 family DNA or RNA helicase